MISFCYQISDRHFQTSLTQPLNLTFNSSNFGYSCNVPKLFFLQERDKKKSSSQKTTCGIRLKLEGQQLWSVSLLAHGWQEGTLHFSVVVLSECSTGVRYEPQITQDLYAIFFWLQETKELKHFDFEICDCQDTSGLFDCEGKKKQPRIVMIL